MTDEVRCPACRVNPPRRPWVRRMGRIALCLPCYRLSRQLHTGWVAWHAREWAGVADADARMSVLELESMRPRITFRVASIPVPKGSMRAFVRGARAILTSDNRSLKGWEAIVRAQAQAHVPALLPAAVAVTLAFALPRTKRLPKTRERAHQTKPDLDKLARAVLDALTGVAFTDDAQVTRLACTKRYALQGEQPGVLVTLGGADDGSA